MHDTLPFLILQSSKKERIALVQIPFPNLKLVHELCYTIFSAMFPTHPEELSQLNTSIDTSTKQNYVNHFLQFVLECKGVASICLTRSVCESLHQSGLVLK